MNKTITLVALFALYAGLTLISCGRTYTEEPVPDPPKTEEPAPDPSGKDPETPKPSVDPPAPTPSKPRSADSIALESLGLRPLELAPGASYPEIIMNEPPLPEPKESYSVNSVKRVFWGYSKPTTLTQFRINRARGYYNAVLTDGVDYGEGIVRFGPEGGYEDRPGVFDSLYRLHGDRDLDIYQDYFHSTPYDLRHVRIAYEGVDISPLFAISYVDYRKALQTGRHRDREIRHVRVSEAGTEVLDWLLQGVLRIVPLTKDYPSCTVYVILRDGTVLSQPIYLVL